MHPINHTFHTIKKYELKGTIQAPIICIPCFKIDMPRGLP